MILGLGIDLVENDRFEEELSRERWCVADGIFARGEILDCNDLGRTSRWYASCFAAKEATLKALNVEVGDLAVFRDVELKVEDFGRHKVDLHGPLKARCEQLGVKHINVCIAQDKKLTIASVVLNE